MMIKYVIAILALSASFVSAQLTVLEPTYSTAYTVGEDAIITWTWPGYQEGVDVISSMDLRYFGGTGIDTLLTIARDVDPGLGRYVWRVPSTGVIVAEDAYDIQFTFTGSNISNSDGLFSIRGPGGVTSSTPTTTTSTSAYVPYTPSYTYPSYTYTPTSSPEDDGGTDTGVIIGAVVGSVGGVGLIAAALFAFFFYKRRQSKEKPVNPNTGYPPSRQGVYPTANVVPTYIVNSDQGNYQQPGQYQVFPTNYSMPTQPQYYNTSAPPLSNHNLLTEQYPTSPTYTADTTLAPGDLAKEHSSISSASHNGEDDAPRMILRPVKPDGAP